MFRQNALSLYGRAPVPSSLQEEVEGWGSEQVIAWLRGLDNSVLPYINFFEIAELDGEGLLLLTHGDLQDMGIASLGVRQVILQATELLSDLCYNLETENLQSMGLVLSVKARHLQNVIKRSMADLLSGEPTFDALGSVCGSLSYLIHDAKKTLSWLDRSPFDRLKRYLSLRERVWSLSVRMTAATQDLRKPERAFRLLQNLALEMEGVGVEMVRGIDDALILATSFLDRAILRRSHPKQELGLNILSSVHGVHVISQVHLKSPADMCGKIDAGDEILQLNGQTVVGWDLRKLIETLSAEKSEIEMILKKRPRESGSMGLPRPKTDTRINLIPTQPPNTTLPEPVVKFRHRSTSFSGFAENLSSEEGAGMEGEPEASGSVGKLGLDGINTRRYTVCGGIASSPNSSGDRRTSLSPQAENSWLDPAAEQRKKELLEVPILNAGGSDFVRNYRLSITHQTIRPMSYVNSELLMPAKDGTLQLSSGDSDEEDNDEVNSIVEIATKESLIEEASEPELATIDIADPNELLPSDKTTATQEWNISRNATHLASSSSSSSEASIESVHVISEADAQLILNETSTPNTPALSQSQSMFSEWHRTDSNPDTTPRLRGEYGRSREEPEDLSTHRQRKLEQFFGDSVPPYATLPRSRPQQEFREPFQKKIFDAIPLDKSTPELKRVKYIGTDYRKPAKGPSVRLPDDQSKDEKVGGDERVVVSDMWRLWRAPSPSYLPSATLHSPVTRTRFPGEKSGEKWHPRHLVLTPRFLVTLKSHNSHKPEAIFHTGSFNFSVHDPGFRSSKKFVIVMENSSLRIKLAFKDRGTLDHWREVLLKAKAEGETLLTNPSESYIITGSTDRPPEDEQVRALDTTILDRTPLSARLSDSLRRSFRFREGSPALSRKGSKDSVSSSSSAHRVLDPLRRPRDKNTPL